MRVSGRFENVFPPGFEIQGHVEEALCLLARMILELQKDPEYPGFLRIVVADSRRLPWIAEEFAAVMDPLSDLLARYLARLTAMGVPELPEPVAGGSPVHGGAQRILSVALDDRSRNLARAGGGNRQRDNADVPAALPPLAIGRSRSRGRRSMIPHDANVVLPEFATALTASIAGGAPDHQAA